jgi:gentisate 1,2-dioxygenase
MECCVVRGSIPAASNAAGKAEAEKGMRMNDGADYEQAKSGWAAAGLAPLWDSAVSHKPNNAAAQLLAWRWADLEPHIANAINLVSPEHVERRVLLFADPALSAPGRAQTSRMLNAGLQILRPGEAARVHRHTIDAIRLVLQGSGAVTRVDGLACPMEPGDLILTPGGAWHEHVHEGDQPIVWLDGLNGPMHRFLGTALFEAGPGSAAGAGAQEPVQDAAFAPEFFGDDGRRQLFRYSHARLKAALEAAPISSMGFARVRYVDPNTGENAISLMDLSAIRIPPDAVTKPFKTNATTINVVLGGEGVTRCGTSVFKWRKNDVFVSPANVFVRHESSPGAYVFQMSDREIYRRLGLLQESFGNSDDVDHDAI